MELPRVRTLTPAPLPVGEGFKRHRCATRGRWTGDLVEVGVGQFAVDAVDEGAEFAGVDEEGLLAAVAEASFGVGYPFCSS